jgi:hypothetical protein
VTTDLRYIRYLVEQGRGRTEVRIDAAVVTPALTSLTCLAAGRGLEL